MDLPFNYYNLFLYRQYSSFEENESAFYLLNNFWANKFLSIFVCEC